MRPTGKRLGELVLRTANVEPMTTFYRDVIGLEPFASLAIGNFLKVADDFEGHPQLLAIFERSWRFSGPRDVEPVTANAASGTLHHFAFAMEQDDFDQERERLEKLGVELQFADHTQFGWHSIYMHDPDGNSVELVCYDSAILDEDENRSMRSIHLQASEA